MQDIDSSNWHEQVEVSGKLVVVEFWHDQCVWCKKLEPIYSTMPNEYSGVVFARFNVLASEENLALGSRFGISGTPTIKVFCEGRDVGEIVGFMDRAELKKELDAIIERAKDCVSKSTAIK